MQMAYKNTSLLIFHLIYSELVPSVHSAQPPTQLLRLHSSNQKPKTKNRQTYKRANAFQLVVSCRVSLVSNYAFFKCSLSAFETSNIQEPQARRACVPAAVPGHRRLAFSKMHKTLSTHRWSRHSSETIPFQSTYVTRWPTLPQKQSLSCGISYRASDKTRRTSYKALVGLSGWLLIKTLPVNPFPSPLVPSADWKSHSAGNAFRML